MWTGRRVAGWRPQGALCQAEQRSHTRMPCDASAQPEGPVRAGVLAGGAGASGTALGALLRSCPCRGVRSLEASLQPQHFRIWPSRLVLYLIVIIISNSEPAHLTLTRHTVTQDQRGLPKTLWVSFRAQDGRWREPRGEGTRKGVTSRGGRWLGWGAVPLSQPRSAPRPRSPHVSGAAPTPEKPPGTCHRRPDGAVCVPGSPDGCRERLVLKARGAESAPELPWETENARECSAKNLLLRGLMFPHEPSTCWGRALPGSAGSRALCRKGRCRCAGPREGWARRAWGGPNGLKARPQGAAQPAAAAEDVPLTAHRCQRPNEQAARLQPRRDRKSQGRTFCRRRTEASDWGGQEAAPDDVPSLTSGRLRGKGPGSSPEPHLSRGGATPAASMEPPLPEVGETSPPSTVAGGAPTPPTAQRWVSGGKGA